MKILFAEDTKDLNRAVCAVLAHEGYHVDPVYDGLEALKRIREDSYDCIVLDIMMPGADGLEVLRQLRKTGIITPVLLLTARAEVDDRVDGLDAGADDYLAKPFDTQELLARVRAMLRRRTSIRPDIASFEDLELDKAAMELRCGQKTSRLSAKAYQLMEMLIERPHTVLSVQQIMDHVWGWDSEAEINVVWVNISFLRKRILELGAHVEIRASRGLGYSLERKND